MHACICTFCVLCRRVHKCAMCAFVGAKCSMRFHAFAVLLRVHHFGRQITMAVSCRAYRCMHCHSNALSNMHLHMPSSRYRRLIYNIPILYTKYINGATRVERVTVHGHDMWTRELHNHREIIECV